MCVCRGEIEREALGWVGEMGEETLLGMLAVRWTRYLCGVKVKARGKGRPNKRNINNILERGGRKTEERDRETDRQ